MTIINYGPISLASIQNEFGGVNPISMSEYYAGGPYVPGGTTGSYGAVPVSPNPISIRTFYGLTAIIPTGYWLGGRSGTTQSPYDIYHVDIDGIIFSTDTATNPAAVLTTARYGGSGFNSSSRGYFAGGYYFVGTTNTASTEIDGIAFSTNTAINPAAVTSVTAGVSVNSATAGYTIVTSITSPGTATSQKFLFSTEAISTFTTTFYMSGGTGVSSSTKGYSFLGGNTAGILNAPTANAAYLLFSNDTTVALSASSASSTMRFGTGFNSTTKGYSFGGGEFGGYGLGLKNNIVALSFSTETVETLAAVQSVTLVYSGGVNSTTKGYAGGGNIATITTANNVSTEIQGLLFSNETAINPSAVLSAARDSPVAVQSGAL